MKFRLEPYHPKTLQRYNTEKADASFVDETPEITDELPLRADEMRRLFSDDSVTSPYIDGCERGIEY